MENLVEHLIQSGVLKTTRIIDAFYAIDRADFVPEEYKSEAYGDYPLSIGEGQTISQPYTVAFMLELLQPRMGHKIMDVGSGSGWTTALLAYIISSQSTRTYAEQTQTNADSPHEPVKGKVIGIEVIPELAKFGEENVRKYNFIEKGIAEIRAMSAKNGLPDEASLDKARGKPFDRILAGAAAFEVPQAWRDQLKPGGRIVMPIDNSIWLFIKKEDGSFEEKEYHGFAFVPFIQ